MHFDFLLHPSNARRWRTRQLTDFHGLVRQTGTQGIPAQAVIILYTGPWLSLFLSQAFTKPADALSARNAFKHAQRQACRLRQRQEGPSHPVSPQAPSVLTTWQASSRHPLQLYPCLEAIITHSDNLSPTALYAITNIISLEWLTSQIHSAPEVLSFSGHNTLSVFTG